jgi:hypothetical protein
MKISCFQLKTQKKRFWVEENSSSDVIDFYVVFSLPQQIEVTS